MFNWFSFYSKIKINFIIFKVFCLFVCLIIFCIEYKFNSLKPYLNKQKGSVSEASRASSPFLRVKPEPTGEASGFFANDRASAGPKSAQPTSTVPPASTPLDGVCCCTSYHSFRTSLSCMFFCFDHIFLEFTNFWNILRLHKQNFNTDSTLHSQLFYSNRIEN